MRPLLYLFAFSALPAWACSCFGAVSAKQAWAGVPLVFAGHAESATSGPGSLFTAQVRVDKAYKGVTAGDVVTLAQRGGCDGPVLLHAPMLFYLSPSRDGKAWRMSQACGRTRLLDEAADDLRFLDALPRSAQSTRISGMAMEFLVVSRPIAGVRVIVAGPDGVAVELVTGADGVYELYGKPPGEYRIDVIWTPTLLARLAITYGRNSGLDYSFKHDKKVVVTLDAEGSAGADFFFNQVAVP